MQRDRIAELLKYTEDTALPEFTNFPNETLSVAEMVTRVMQNQNIDFVLRLACADFLGFLGTSPKFKTPMTKILSQFARTDLDLQSARALARIAGTVN
jgi:hypothetical protein